MKSVKGAGVLSHNQITEIVMDSESGNRRRTIRSLFAKVFPITQPASPDFSASSSDEEDNVGNVAEQPQPCVWALPPKPQKRVVHNFIGAPKGKSSEAAHITKESIPLSVLLLFFAEIITMLVVET
jgi:hypothetical protein